MSAPVHEDLLPLAAASQLLPRNTNGKSPSIQTLRRWAQRGSRNTFLEMTFVGGRAFVSRQALLDFIARRNAADRRIVSPSPTVAAVRADAKLRKLGA